MLKIPPVLILKLAQVRQQCARLVLHLVLAFEDSRIIDFNSASNSGVIPNFIDA
jgi:hypothetical protein